MSRAIQIQDLLNPSSEDPHLSNRGHRFSSATPGSSPVDRDKRPKMAKDAPIFRHGKPHGEVRYPPCEDRTPELAEIHKKYSLHPMGNIADYPRHIPYQSDKKSFHEKTGRDSFHVYQYTFKIPNKDTTWTIMWDYNIGLVRTTHLFKCMNHSKTAPGRVLNKNPGLREICHSITGGALAAQGYWMPFEAAKAMAATFCWDIRHILTPLFGANFPSMCVPPAERAQNFDHAIIDPAIVQRATETAHYYRSLEFHSGGLSSGTTSPAMSGPDTVARYGLRANEDYSRRQIFPKMPRHNYAASVHSTRESSSEPYCMSPTSPARSGFTPINAPRSAVAPPPPPSRVPSPRSFLSYVKSSHKLNMAASVSGESEAGDVYSTPRSDYIRTPPFPPTNAEPLIHRGYLTSTSTDSASDLSDYDEIMSTDEAGSLDDEDDEDYREPHKKMNVDATGKSKRNPARSVKSRDGDRAPAGNDFAHEVKAAHALLRLHMQEASRDDTSDEDEPMQDASWGPPLDSRPRDARKNTRKRRRVSV